MNSAMHYGRAATHSLGPWRTVPTTFDVLRIEARVCLYRARLSCACTICRSPSNVAVAVVSIGPPQKVKQRESTTHKHVGYLVDPASFGTLNLELKPCILLTAYPATGRAISVHGSVDRWDEGAVLRSQVITTETLWLIPFLPTLRSGDPAGLRSLAATSRGPGGKGAPPEGNTKY